MDSDRFNPDERGAIKNFDRGASCKSTKSRHSHESGSPGLIDFTGCCSTSKDTRFHGNDKTYEYTSFARGPGLTKLPIIQTSNHLWKVKYFFCCLCVFLSFALSLTACRNQSEKQAGPPEKITIAYVINTNGVLVQIAFAKGYFKEEELDAVPQPHAFGKPALQAVIDGKADLATVADTPIMFAVMDGRRITTLAVIQTANRNEAIVAKGDRGVVKPSDLKGKTIGVTLGTTSDFFTEVFLIAHGIDRKQVTIIDLKPDEMVAALGTGKADAVSTWNPVLTQLQRDMGNKGLTFYGDTLYTEYFCLVAGQKYVKEHPETVRKVLRALIRAETFAKKNPEESRRLVAAFIKTDKTILDEMWNVFTFRVTLDQALIVDLEDQTRWAMKHRLTTRRNMPNYLDFVYVDGLQAVKPDAVRIIR
jgi:ABC-type nitrate/sulfonate/bicarbonate transport system substrate-binding protein